MLEGGILNVRWDRRLGPQMRPEKKQGGPSERRRVSLLMLSSLQGRRFGGGMTQGGSAVQGGDEAPLTLGLVRFDDGIERRARDERMGGGGKSTRGPATMAGGMGHVHSAGRVDTSREITLQCLGRKVGIRQALEAVDCVGTGTSVSGSVPTKSTASSYVRQCRQVLKPSHQRKPK